MPDTHAHRPQARRSGRTARAILLAAATTLLLTLSATLASCGEDEAADAATRAGAVTVEDAWVRATSGTDDPTMTAAFLTVDNDTDDDVVLESASSEVAGTAQLHEMAMVDGASVMREADAGILVKAHGGQLLQPGGYHVMLMRLHRELAPGDEVELTLGFSDGTTLEVTAPVKAFTEEQGHYHAPGTGEHSH